MIYSLVKEGLAMKCLVKLCIIELYDALHARKSEPSLILSSHYAPVLRRPHRVGYGNCRPYIKLKPRPNYSIMLRNDCSTAEYDYRGTSLRFMSLCTHSHILHYLQTCLRPSRLRRYHRVHNHFILSHPDSCTSNMRVRDLCS